VLLTTYADVMIVLLTRTVATLQLPNRAGAICVCVMEIL